MSARLDWGDLVALALMALWASVLAVVLLRAQVAPPGPPRLSFTATVRMTVTPATPRAFTLADLGLVSWEGLPTRIECYGSLDRTKGAVRYFVDGTAPTALVGTLVPPVNAETQPFPAAGPERTLDGPYTFFLYRPDHVRGFKAIAATTADAAILWSCHDGP